MGADVEAVETFCGGISAGGNSGSDAATANSDAIKGANSIGDTCMLMPATAPRVTKRGNATTVPRNRGAAEKDETAVIPPQSRTRGNAMRRAVTDISVSAYDVGSRDVGDTTNGGTVVVSATQPADSGPTERAVTLCDAELSNALAIARLEGWGN